jgi:hypothetical protein
MIKNEKNEKKNEKNVEIFRFPFFGKFLHHWKQK